MSRDFDGSGDFLTYADGTDIRLSGDHTVSVWAYPDSVSGYRTVFCKSSGGTREYGLFFESASKTYLAIGGGETSATNSANWTTGSWQHIVLRRIGSAVTVWRNGVQIASATHSNSSTVTNGLKLGKDDVGGGTDFDGLLAELAVWQGYGLSDAEIAALYVGYLPTQVRLESLKLYDRVWGAASSEPETMGRTPTVTNTTGSRAHPPVRAQVKYNLEV